MGFDGDCESSFERSSYSDLEGQLSKENSKFSLGVQSLIH